MIPPSFSLCTIRGSWGLTPLSFLPATPTAVQSLSLLTWTNTMAPAGLPVSLPSSSFQKPPEFLKHKSDHVPVLESPRRFSLTLEEGTNRGLRARSPHQLRATACPLRPGPVPLPVDLCPAYTLPSVLLPQGPDSSVKSARVFFSDANTSGRINSSLPPLPCSAHISIMACLI